MGNLNRRMRFMSFINKGWVEKRLSSVGVSLLLIFPSVCHLSAQSPGLLGSLRPPASAPPSSEPKWRKQHEALWEGPNSVAQNLYPTRERLNHFSSCGKEAPSQAPSQVIIPNNCPSNTGRQAAGPTEVLSTTAWEALLHSLPALPPLLPVHLVSVSAILHNLPTCLIKTKWHLLDFGRHIKLSATC